MSFAYNLRSKASLQVTVTRENYVYRIIYYVLIFLNSIVPSLNPAKSPTLSRMYSHLNIDSA